MRIGVDARQLCGKRTGVGSYLAGLIEQWAQRDAGNSHQFVLYAPEPIALTLDSRRFTIRVVEGHGGAWWEQGQLPRAVARDGVDVFFAPQYTAPLRLRVPVVVAIHDVSFAAHPEWFPVAEGLRLRALSRWAASSARAVITISQFSQREIIERLGVPESRIHVIPPGIPPRRAPRHAADSGHTHGIRALFVGSIFGRRHVLDLIRAFAPIARAHPTASLDIVGDNRSHPREDIEAAIGAEQLDAQVRWHQYASDEQLCELYAAARVFTFLSEYEGLGLTPLEALSVGVPPVLLDTPVARESCGDAALYARLHPLADVTSAIEQALFDAAMRDRLLAAAPAVLAKYDWPRAARETLAVLEQAGQ